MQYKSGNAGRQFVSSLFYDLQFLVSESESKKPLLEAIFDSNLTVTCMRFILLYELICTVVPYIRYYM